MADGVSRRLEAIAESATLAISARAQDMRARGQQVVDFGAGEPDFPTPAHVVEAAAAACRDTRHHRYTPTAGLPELRRAITVKTRSARGGCW
jgi:aspartate aminotransferase